MENNIAEKMKSNPPKEHIAYHKKINKSRTQSSHSSKNKTKTQHAQQPTKSGNGKAIAELIALLHAAIQEHQQYPSSALEMEREGNATLVFTLLPNGAVKRLRLLQSSGVTALDEAAIAAINDALPFKGIDKFLKNPTEFQITVGFQLT